MVGDFISSGNPQAVVHNFRATSRARKQANAGAWNQASHYSTSISQMWVLKKNVRVFGTEADFELYCTLGPTQEILI
jgi:hypothetical protein